MDLEAIVRWLTRLQQQLDSLIKPETGRWIDWTPTVTQSGAVAATVDRARYIVQGNAAIVTADLSVTGAGTGGNAIVIGGIPATIAINGFTVGLTPLGVGFILDANVGGYLGFPIPLTSTTFVCVDTVTRNNIGVNPNFALANGDSINFRVIYER